MPLDSLKHSAILSTLFKMADDIELIGASEFIKGKWKSGSCVNLLTLTNSYQVCQLNNVSISPIWLLTS